MRNFILCMLMLGICSADNIAEKLNKNANYMVNLSEKENDVGGSVDSKGVSINAKFDRHAALLLMFGLCQVVYVIWVYYRTQGELKDIRDKNHMELVQFELFLLQNNGYMHMISGDSPELAYQLRI